MKYANFLKRRKYIEEKISQATLYWRIYTPTKLVKQITLQVPIQNITKNSRIAIHPLKTGEFYFTAVLWLMDILKDEILEEQLRFEHIYNNMLYCIYNHKDSVEFIKDIIPDVSDNMFLEEKNVNEKFDVIIMNPPYNVGMLDKKNSTICNSNDEVIKKAASTRIDAAMIVDAFENRLNNGGTLAAIWPYSWTQLPSWKNFRDWIKRSGLISISSVDDSEFPVAVNTAITLQTKGSKKKAVFINNSRNSEYQIDFSKNIIPNCYGGRLGKSIFDKEYKYKNKLKTILFKNYDKNIHKYVSMLATGYGLGGVITKINLNISTLSETTKKVAGPIKPEEFHLINKSDAILVIIFDSQEEKDRYQKYHKSNLYNFILHQRKADFHNTNNNIGFMPNVCKNMVGEYTDQKAYNILGITPEEAKFIEKTVGLPVFK